MGRLACAFTSWRPAAAWSGWARPRFNPPRFAFPAVNRLAFAVQRLRWLHFPSLVLLSLLHPLLATRYPGLPAVYTGLNQLQVLLEKEHRPDGSWVPVSGLSTSARQQIDAACDQVLQELAPIASIAEPRNTDHGF